MTTSANKVHFDEVRIDQDDAHELKVANEPEVANKKTCSKLMPILLSILLVAGIVVGVLFATDTIGGSDSADTLEKSGDSADGGSIDGDSTGPNDDNSLTRGNCDSVASGERLFMYWQTEVAGCKEVPDGVTHVVFGDNRARGLGQYPCLQCT